MKEFGKFVDGKLKTGFMAEEAPEGMKEIIREPWYPEDKDVIFKEEENAIYITYDKTEKESPSMDE